MKEETLKLLGLSDKEVKIYLANLRLGSSLVQKIANFANLNRTSAYDLLSSLEQKGFATHTISSGKKYYQAIQPKNIISLLKERESLVKDILPELNSISNNAGKRPNVEVYIGKNGLKTIFEGILNEAKSFDTISSKDNLLKLFEFYFPNFVEQRKKKGIKVRLIGDSQPLDKQIPFKKIKKPLKTATLLYRGKIAMISLDKKEPIGILIDEKNFYETQKIMFDLLWDNL